MKQRIGNVISALRDLGDLSADFTVDRVVLPGITRVFD